MSQSVLSPVPAAAKDRLIFALDVDDIDLAEHFVRRLAPHVGAFKLGPQLFIGAGPLVIDLVRGMGAQVFLDLKFHDIPATVAAVAQQVSRMRVRMFTVHALGGRAMIRRAAQEIRRTASVPGLPQPLLLAVTLLTSLNELDIEDVGLTQPLQAQSERLARLAMASGAHGVVASPKEVAFLRTVLPPDTVYVTPGIRASTAPTDDQARVMSAREAIEAGSTYLVVGRPIRDAPDPVAEARRIVGQIEAARPPPPLASA